MHSCPGPATLIDVHSHFLPQGYVREMERAGIEHPDGIARWPVWELDGLLEMMEQAGVAKAILSVSSPGVAIGDRGRTAALARDVNEQAAGIVRARPDTFGFFASVPLPNVEGAVEEAVFALDHLRADGLVLMTNYEGTYLGDAIMDELFEVLDDRKAVVFVHPTSPPFWEETSLGFPRPMLEFFFETTRAVTNYLLRGGQVRYPNVRVIVPHAGAALPALADRLAGFVERRVAPSELHAEDVLSGLRGLWYDLAGYAAGQQSHAIRRLVGLDRLLYGTDYPFTSRDQVMQNLAALQGGSALTAEELADRLRSNAAEVLSNQSERAGSGSRR